MVFYSIQADKDLEGIREGLLIWKKFKLNREVVLDYMADLKDTCESIGEQTFHAKASHSEHKRYGEKVFRYKRNPSTTWYIIYNVDIYNNIYINKIISNHLTY